MCSQFFRNKNESPQYIERIRATYFEGWLRIKFLFSIYIRNNAACKLKIAIGIQPYN